MAGNLTHLLSRFVAHRKSLFRILNTGSAKSHRGNPAANLKIHNIFCSPVLFSGTGSLNLNTLEVAKLDQHLKLALQRLQKLPDRTPHCVVMFLGGQLPGKAILHLRMFSIFGMISRIPGSVIHRIAEYQLTTSKPSSGSWFLTLRDLCVKYVLPSPQSLLKFPMPKDKYKNLVKSRIIDFWECHLRTEANKLSHHSLQYFKPEFMSLTCPHPLWTSCGSNPFEIHKAVTQAKMLSGTYVTDKLSRHWSNNPNGFCSIPGCTGNTLGSIEHLLLSCPALQESRVKLDNLALKVASESEELQHVLSSVLSQTSAEVVQFLLDCSSHPLVIQLRQKNLTNITDRLFYLTRTWCYTIHRSRMTKLGLFEYR